MLPDVSIIIPVYNAKDTMEDCLHSVMQLDYPKDKLEIIIVDNCSSDGTRKIIDKYDLKVIDERRKGSYASRNAGIQIARGEYIAFIDSDCFPSKDWVRNLLGGFTDKKIAGCGGKIVAYKPDSVVERFLAQNGVILNQERAIEYVPLFLPAIITANAMYRKSVVEEVGMFDSSMISWGDNDLSWRVQLAGHGIKYIPNAIVHHKHRSNLEKLFKQYFRMGFGYYSILKKYNNRIGRHSRLVTLRESGTFYRLFWQAIKNILCNSNNSLENVYYSFLDIFVYLARICGRVYAILQNYFCSILCINKENVKLQW